MSRKRWIDRALLQGAHKLRRPPVASRFGISERAARFQFLRVAVCCSNVEEFGARSLVASILKLSVHRNMVRKEQPRKNLKNLVLHLLQDSGVRGVKNIMANKVVFFPANYEGDLNNCQLQYLRRA
eukprot:Selendium_serpulae@DN6311_c1_g2_i1.p1